MNKIGQIAFKVGIVDVDLQSLDLEKLTGHITITFPLGGLKIDLSLNSGFNWSQDRNITFRTTVREDKPKPPEEDLEEDEEYDEDHA